MRRGGYKNRRYPSYGYMSNPQRPYRWALLKVIITAQAANSKTSDVLAKNDEVTRQLKNQCGV
jgi:hypothetical protein